MQTVMVANNPVSAKNGPARKTDSADAFNALLVAAQTAQVAAMTKTFADSTGLQARDTDAASAQQARVTQETTEARTAEVNAHAARRADSSSVQDGQVSARHERILADKAAAPESKVQSHGSGFRSDQAKGLPESSAFRPAADGPGVSPASDAGMAQEKSSAIVSGAGKLDAPSPVEQASPATTPVATAPVATAGAPATRPSTEGDSAANTSAARAVGRLLADRGAVEAVKAPSESQAPGPARQNTSQPRPEQAAKQSEQAESKDPKKTSQSPDGARKAAFEQLIQQVQLNKGVRVSSATIRLDPPELGKMRIDVRMVDDALRVRVDAASPHARQLLASRVEELAAALREHNVEVQKLEIVGPGDSGHGFSTMTRDDTEEGARTEDGRWMGDASGHADDGETSAGGSEETDTSAGPDSPTTYAATDSRLDVRI